MKVQPCVQTGWAMRGKSNIKIEERIGRQGKTQTMGGQVLYKPMGSGRKMFSSSLEELQQPEPSVV